MFIIVFFAFKCYVTSMPLTLYQPLLNLFNIIDLSEKRKINYTKFVFKLVNDYIHSSEQLSFLNFNIHRYRTGTTTIFILCIFTNNYVLVSPINRIISLANDTKNVIV